ncbi:MAG: hypothetical protein ACOCX9_01290 [Spirochaetota bacterium]
MMIRLMNYYPALSISIGILIALFLLHVPASAALWSWQLDQAGRHEAVLEIDPYYSNVEYIYGFTTRPIPRKLFQQEGYIYLNMLKDLYRPRFILFEASVYPLPIAGVYIRKNHENFYEDSRVSDNIYAVKAITAGFPEPWAGSIFLGNVINFVSTEDKVVGKGYSGFLLSYGNRHIVDNIMVEDNWVESEIKIKGDSIREERNISWSYAIGVKLHENSEIKNVVYLSIIRDRIDLIDNNLNPVWKFIFHNSEQELRVDSSISEDGQWTATRYLFLLGKKFPIGSGKVTFAFSIGGLKTLGSGYSGSLEKRIDERWNFLLRPNVHVKF